MANLTLWLVTICLFSGTYLVLRFPPAAEFPWQVKSAVWVKRRSNRAILLYDSKKQG